MSLRHHSSPWQSCYSLTLLRQPTHQGDKIATPDKRVHCSLNINTETGRLSARRPNLQNQPALEKDRYKATSPLPPFPLFPPPFPSCLGGDAAPASSQRLLLQPLNVLLHHCHSTVPAWWCSNAPQIRKAFTANVAEGKTLIVADYGQLELRLLAHMANCKSMLEAFKLGGDFHSRTALGMYDYIKEDTAAGNVLLEWDYPDVRTTHPLRIRLC